MAEPVRYPAEKVVAVVALLRAIARDHSPAVFANSFGAEDMVLTHLIASEQIAITPFAIDTGRLPPETYALMGHVEARYGKVLGLVFPERTDVEHYVAAHGINGFYDSVDLRKACCHARKVAPLQRVLAGKAAWVTGLRAAQSATRDQLQVQSFDASNGLEKFSPLADWSEAEVWAFIREHEVPYNALHDQGYPSLGCAPCTRAIQPGEDIRAGRWWWETPETKECGLHMIDGRLQRVKVEPARSDSPLQS